MGVGGGVKSASQKLVSFIDKLAKEQKAAEKAGDIETALLKNKELKGAIQAGVNSPAMPRAKPLSDIEIQAFAERMAPQVAGELTRGKSGAKTVAGKTQQQFQREKTLPVDRRVLEGQRDPMAPLPEMTLEQQKGGVLLGLPGDPTLARMELSGIGDVAFEKPVTLYGGPRYGDDEKLWASNIAGASNLVGAGRRASEQYGGAPVYASFMKMPEGFGFAQHYLESLLQYTRPDQLPKAARLALEQDIRKGFKDSKKKYEFPEFAGFGDLEAVSEQALRNSKLRGHIADRLEKSKLYGLRPAGDVEFAVTHPELTNIETGAGGFTIGELPLNEPFSASAHPTYTHDIPGKVLGQTRHPTPYDLLYRDQLEMVKKNPTIADEPFGTVKLLGARQQIDEQLVNEINEYQERLRRMIGKKAGGLAEGGVPEKRDVSQLFPLKVPADNAELKPQPKYPLIDKASQGVQAIHDFVSAPFGYENPAGEMVSSFLEVPSIAKALGNIAYDMPMTTGSGMTTDLRPEVSGAAMGVAPLIGPAVKTAKKVGKAIAPTAAEMALDLAEKGGTPVRQFAVPPSDVKPGKVKAPADKLGFYSNVEKAALNLQRKAGTGDTFLADLMKNPGVGEARLEELGLTELRGNRNVTADEVRQLAAKNKPQLSESIRVEPSQTKISALESEYEDLSRELHDLQGSGNSRAIARVEAELEKNVLEQKYIKDETPADFGPESKPNYNTPGGKNYREIRIKLPSNRPSLKNMSREEYNAAVAKADREGIQNFTESIHHGDEENVLLHLRVKDHVDAEGRKGLLIDELQSDWHQQGKKKGYKGNISIDSLNEEANKIAKERRELVKEFNEHMSYANSQEITPEMQNRWNVFRAKEDALDNKKRSFERSVPNAPFKDNWYQLGLKRAIKEATDNGMDRVYLTTGKTQNDRYSLSKHVDEVIYSDQGVLYARGKDGQTVINEKVPESKLADYIGNDAAKKLISSKEDVVGSKVLSGADLEVGGEGMKQWYDKTYLNYLKKYANEHGATVGMTTLKGSTEPVYFLDLTPKLKDTAKKGQSYAQGGVVNIDDLVAEAYKNAPINLDNMVNQALSKKFAEGGAAYNTTPDMADGGQFIQGEAF